MTDPNRASATTYRWPWFILGAAILSILLAFLWMTREVQRTKRIRDASAPTGPAAVVPTNPPSQ